MSDNYEERREKRLGMRRPGYVILQPDAPMIECVVTDISHRGAGLNIGALALPKTFLLVLSPDGKVTRPCKLVWRRGELAGVRFITAAELIDSAR